MEILVLELKTNKFGPGLVLITHACTMCPIKASNQSWTEDVHTLRDIKLPYHEVFSIRKWSTALQVEKLQSMGKIEYFEFTVLIYKPFVWRH